ncbi:MAG TPA: hypothetical protein VF613_02005 [Longimicrobium sp.]|jgi:hypothetical protein
MRIVLVALTLLSAGCASAPRRPSGPAAPSPYLLVFAGDRDEADEDFFAVIDVRPGGSKAGQVVSTTRIGTRASMPHHMEYELPASGESILANAHHHETTLLLDVSDPRKPVIERTFGPPAPYRFGHDFARLMNGNLLLGFLRSEGPSPNAADPLVPGGHGGIAEYTSRGELLRSASAAVAGHAEPIRPYAIVPMLDIDRVVTTSAPMMEDHVADVVQVWRYSDLSLLHTIAVPAARTPDGSTVDGAHRYPFGPRRMGDGSILMNAYGCGFYRLSGIGGERPELAHVYTIQVPEPLKPGGTRGACSIPVVIGSHWIMPVGRAQTVVVLDVSDPARPREVSRLDTPADFNPHWAAKDPASERIVIGAELGGEQGMYILRFDASSGRLRFDPTIVSRDGKAGYIDLEQQQWPHGPSGAAWGHAALFLAESR